MTPEDISKVSYGDRCKWQDLCKLAEDLGYRCSSYGQLQNNNGSFATSFIDMIDDNPGLAVAITDWLAENHGKECEVCGMFECECCEDCGCSQDDCECGEEEVQMSVENVVLLSVAVVLLLFAVYTRRTIK